MTSTLLSAAGQVHAGATHVEVRCMKIYVTSQYHHELLVSIQFHSTIFVQLRPQSLSGSKDEVKHVEEGGREDKTETKYCKRPREKQRIVKN